MLSAQTAKRLANLRSAQSRYRPSSDVLARLEDKVVLMFVGPSACGKNTVIDAVAATSNQFGLVGNQTSREPRDTDTRYTYFAHTDAGLEPLLSAIDTQQLVQYAVSFYEPYYIYASAASDYAATYCMKDVFFDAVAQFRSLPFKRVVAINLITAPKVWLPRFNTRFPVGDRDRAGRVSHAIKSLEWSLAQPDGDSHVWVENDSDVQQTVAEIIQIAQDGHTPDSRRLRAMAQDTLRMLQEVQV